MEIIKDVKYRKILNSVGGWGLEIILITDNHKSSVKVPVYDDPGQLNHFIGHRILDQKTMDKQLMRLRDRLGHGPIMGMSIAIARVLSSIEGIKLHEHMRRLSGRKRVPRIAVTLITGKRHSDNSLSFRNIMSVQKIDEAMKTYNEVDRLVRKKYEHNFITEDGGHSPFFRKTREALDIAIEAGSKNILIDSSSYNFSYPKGYFIDGEFLPEKKMKEFYDWINRKYPLSGIVEPGMKIRNELSAYVPRNTITDMVRGSKEADIILKHGPETEDDWLADIGLGLGTRYINFGGLSRSEHLAKYNRFENETTGY